MSASTMQAPQATPEMPAALPKSAFQKRIDALTRDKHQADRDVQRLQAENVELRRQVSQQAEEITKLDHAFRLAAGMVNRYKQALIRRRNER